MIVPGLVGEAGGDSVLRQKLANLDRFANQGQVGKIASLPVAATKEALYLGMEAKEIHLEQGPLTVSALGFDPPERSTHFHLSLLTYIDGLAYEVTEVLELSVTDKLMEEAKRLDGKLLTTLVGEGTDHALVWEALGDLGTTNAADLVGKKILGHLPDGDGEARLRRYIDDSINLLTGLEFNTRRMDEGLPPINLLWPWGHGVRTRVPNLALRRGEPATVESSSLRLAGLTRLAGYKHGKRSSVGNGVHTQFRELASRAVARQLTIMVLDGAEQLRKAGKFEELEWFVQELDRKLVEPLLDDQRLNDSHVTLLAPSTTGEGLFLVQESSSPMMHSYPFDERTLEEATASTQDLNRLVNSAILMD